MERALVIVTHDDEGQNCKQLWKNFAASVNKDDDNDYYYRDINNTKVIFVRQKKFEKKDKAKDVASVTTRMCDSIYTLCSDINGPIHIFDHRGMINKNAPCLAELSNRIKFPVDGFLHAIGDRVWNKIDELLKNNFDKEILEFFFDYLKMFWPAIQNRLISLLMPIVIDLRGVTEVCERDVSIAKKYLDEVRGQYNFCQRLADIRHLISKNVSDEKISEAIKTFRQQYCGDKSLETLIEDSKYKEQLRDQLEKLEYLFGVENDHDQSPIFKFFSMLDSLKSNKVTADDVIKVVNFFKDQTSENIPSDNQCISEDKSGWDPYGTKKVCIQSFADWFEEIKKILKAIQEIIAKK